MIDAKAANVRYHDYAADDYDAKWSISFDRRCVDYVRSRFVAVAGEPAEPYRRVLEIGAGTGFFLLNLITAGLARGGVVTDISTGMVAAALRNAASLGHPVSGQVVDAERLPFADGSFDLVVGHAVLHHIPDVGLALGEVLRVLRPGGRFVFAGEPTREGDFVARRLSRLTWAAATRLLPPGWRRPPEELQASSEAAALEAVVDLHTFVPARLADTATRAGAVGVSVVGHELTASWLGWPVRTFECAVRPGRLGPGWATAAYRGWLALDAVDSRLLARVVPGRFFYNVAVTGLRP